MELFSHQILDFSLSHLSSSRRLHFDALLRTKKVLFMLNIQKREKIYRKERTFKGISIPDVRRKRKKFIKGKNSKYFESFNATLTFHSHDTHNDVRLYKQKKTAKKKIFFKGNFLAGKDYAQSNVLHPPPCTLDIRITDVIRHLHNGTPWLKTQKIIFGNEAVLAKEEEFFFLAYRLFCRFRVHASAVFYVCKFYEWIIRLSYKLPTQ